MSRPTPTIASPPPSSPPGASWPFPAAASAYPNLHPNAAASAYTQDWIDAGKPPVRLDGTFRPLVRNDEAHG